MACILILLCMTKAQFVSVDWVETRNYVVARQKHVCIALVIIKPATCQSLLFKLICAVVVIEYDPARIQEAHQFAECAIVMVI